MSGAIAQDIRYFLEKKEFLNVATCDFSSRPNVVPKFIIKIKKNFIYLSDYVFGRTYNNLKINSKVSLATIDLERLVGYQLNGVAKILENGKEYKSLLKDMNKKQIDFSVIRLIEGLHREKKYKDFEVTFPERVCFFKIKIEEVAEIGITGKVRRKRL